MKREWSVGSAPPLQSLVFRPGVDRRHLEALGSTISEEVKEAQWG